MTPCSFFFPHRELKKAQLAKAAAEERVLSTDRVLTRSTVQSSSRGSRLIGKKMNRSLSLTIYWALKWNGKECPQMGGSLVLSQIWNENCIVSYWLGTLHCFITVCAYSVLILARWFWMEEKHNFIATENLSSIVSFYWPQTALYCMVKFHLKNFSFAFISCVDIS